MMVPLLNGSPHVDELGLSKNRIDIETGYCNLLQLAVLFFWCIKIQWLKCKGHLHTSRQPPAAQALTTGKHKHEQT